MNDTENAGGEESGPENLDTGAYEVLRRRLSDQAAELANRAEALNARRIEAFGGNELRVLGADRIRTANNCVPRDIVQVGGHMLFGFNVYIGLKPETEVGDVFARYDFSRDGEKFAFAEAGDDGGLLADDRFRRAFGELYRYYRDTRLLQLRVLDGRLLAVFQIGETGEDLRVLRWNLTPDGSAEFVDDKGERDHVFPSQHDFEWIETSREDHVGGRHPHVSIEGEVFVECVGGELTVKVEDNTETGEGIYSEPVDDRDQALADADISYARVGPLLLVRIVPYRETEARHLVFNSRTKTVVRLDGVGQACRRLPDDQGVIFPGGYYLATGAHRTFDVDVSELEFEREVRSPNGEDVLYVFHARVEGRSLLLPYNVIRKEIANPIPCHGYSLFEDGTMAVFRAAGDEPARVHPMQAWQTPFVSETHAAGEELGDGPLERLGNAELVRAISETLSVRRMVADMAPSTAVFEAIAAACTRCFDAFPWLSDDEMGELHEPLEGVRKAAEQVVDEFETVAALTAQAAEALAEADKETRSLLRRAAGENPKSADAWVDMLALLRRTQGRIGTLRDLRYMDLEAVGRLETEAADGLAATGRRATAFLQRPEAFDSYTAEIERLAGEAEQIESTAAAEPLHQKLSEEHEKLELLVEVVSGLDISDAVVRTAILERISEVLAGVNRARAGLDARRRELASGEGRAEFAAEFALFGQAVTAALASADSPDACDDQLGRLMLQLENLESRFSEFDDFLSDLGDKRTDVYEAFSSRKQTLLDERARRGERLAASAERILSTVSRRTQTLDSVDEVNAYFASDPMVAKLRQIAEELGDLGDNVRSEELLGRIQAARQEAGRSLRDRVDLFDGETLTLGEHRIPVNTQPTELTLVPSGEELAFSLSGTDYRSVVDDPEFASTREYWSQLTVSETEEVYRSEYLAVSMLHTHDRAELRQAALSESDLTNLVRREAESRYDEGYERGVHDADAAAILHELVRLEQAAGLLRYPPDARAAASLYWTFGVESNDKRTLAVRARSLGAARELFARPKALDELLVGLCRNFEEWRDETGLPLDASAELAAEYLFEELAAGGEEFAASGLARQLRTRFRDGLGRERTAEFERDLKALPSLADRWQLVSAWLDGYAQTVEPRPEEGDLAEAAALELCEGKLARRDHAVDLSVGVEGLLGTHRRIEGRRLEFRLDELLARVDRFRRERVPGFRRFQQRRNELVEKEKRRLRLEEFKPKVFSGFVRNRLLDEVYLPLIGANLAKQVGAAGDSKRTDQSGMLLLISPPGYGKTTLMEYVASRLGMVFVKVNGPSLGHNVVNVDPDDAPDATARQEVEKINFALAAGNNVMLYLDDIQHTSPELLQKFISLCDAQRRMEGVWEGRTRTWDMRGKRFAVVMAGNPYTEAGQRFRIPDMLANRADVWNLGDVLSGREEVFALSYIENALTSNPVLASLAGRDRADLELLIRLARGEEGAEADALGHPYSAAELEQILSVLRKLLRVQEIVLANNQAYIASAAMDDSARVEPAFGLQGSYRNMNKLAERIVPVMNSEELEGLVDDHYLGEAQTLASGAEANLLKLAELRGRLGPEQEQRWRVVKEAFRRRQALGGDEEDPTVRAVGALGLLAEKLGAVESAIARASDPRNGKGTVYGSAEVPAAGE